MFTSEPSLPQRIERMIGDMPVVDTRSDLDPARPHATDLAALIAAPPVRLVLGGVGAPRDLFDPARSAEERVATALPFLKSVRNTAAAWCLYRIFRDLYDFDEPHLTAANYPALMDRVEQVAAEPDRARRVIQGRARVRVVVAPAPSTASRPAEEAEPTGAVPAADFLAFRMDIVAVDAPDASTREVRSGVFAQLDERIDGAVRFAAFAEPLGTRHPAHAAVLEWHDLHRAPLQLVLGGNPHNRFGIGAVERAAGQYPGARFGLLATRPEAARLAARLAARHPNVFLDGYPAPGAGPSTVGRAVRERVDLAGATKFGGFASLADSAEWVYGALQVTKKATAAALARAVEGGFFEEDEIPPILRSIFDSAPAEWYGL